MFSLDDSTVIASEVGDKEPNGGALAKKVVREALLDGAAGNAMFSLSPGLLFSPLQNLIPDARGNSLFRHFVYRLRRSTTLFMRPLSNQSIQNLLDYGFIVLYSFLPLASCFRTDST